MEKATRKETISNLQELTSQETGIVLYGDDGILCNWSEVKGLPRIFANVIVGMGEDIPVVNGEHLDDLASILDGVYMNICIDAGVPTSGTVYDISEDDGILVIAPDGWE